MPAVIPREADGGINDPTSQPYCPSNHYSPVEAPCWCNKKTEKRAAQASAHTGPPPDHRTGEKEGGGWTRGVTWAYPVHYTEPRLQMANDVKQEGLILSWNQ